MVDCLPFSSHTYYGGDGDGDDYSDGDGFLINKTIMKKTLKYIYKNFRYMLCICPLQTKHFDLSDLPKFTHFKNYSE